MECRILPVEEWGKLDATYLGPARPLLHPETCTVFTVEEAAQIVGTWTAMRVWHVEGLSGVASSQTNGVIGRHLLRRMRAFLDEHQVSAVITNADTPMIADWLMRLGGQKIAGDGYVWRP